MKKIVKENINVLFGIMIGFSLGGISVFASSLIASKDVSYENPLSNVANVQEAVEELYTLTEGNKFVLENGFRYTGANPNNYVSFNNEVWRIIGFIDNKIKIVKETPIGNYPWDSNETNNWENSSLYNYLNTTYYNSLDSTSKNMVENATWRIGGWHTTDINVFQMYEKEGSTKGAGANTLTVTSFIGLMSASDYGYASDGCKGGIKTLENYNDPVCTSTNWLLLKDNEWLITPNSSGGGIFSVYASGYIHHSNKVTNPNVVRPSLYLKPNVKIKSGKGTSKDPFIFEIKQL